VLGAGTHEVTDFQVGVDIVDLRELLALYPGNDPVADHVLALHADGSGGTTVEYTPTWVAGAAPRALITLDHVLPSSLHVTVDGLVL
jgi:hypothetical protein